MIISKRLSIVLALIVLTSSLLLIRSDPGRRDSFTGVCVRSYPTYSLIFNGSSTLLVKAELRKGEAYTVRGSFFSSGDLLSVRGKYSVEGSAVFEGGEWVKGYYWEKRGRPYLISEDEWIPLGKRLKVGKGFLVYVRGLFYGKELFPTEIREIAGIPAEPEDGHPIGVRGVILPGSPPRLFSNGTEFYLSLPYGLHLKPGRVVEVTGIVRETTKLWLYVYSGDDVRTIGLPPVKELGRSGKGDLVGGTCRVYEVKKSGLRLDCTEKLLRGFHARTADRVKFLALDTGGYLYCLNCTVLEERERLPNGICGAKPGSVEKVEGRVEWVKRYSSGFQLANLSNGVCWLLLKIPKSTGKGVLAGEELTVYGLVSTYRGKPAITPSSGDDLCSSKC